jgi:hypothetical protein
MDDVQVQSLLKRAQGQIRYRYRQAVQEVPRPIIVVVESAQLRPHIQTAACEELADDWAPTWEVKEKIRLINEAVADCPDDQFPVVVFDHDDQTVPPVVVGFPVPDRKHSDDGPDDPFELLEGNVLWLALKQQELIGEGRIDLAFLWRASGRARKHSPRRYVSAMKDHLDHVEFGGKKPDDPVWVGYNDAFGYCQQIDYTFQEVIGLCFSRSLRADPVGMVMKAPDECKNLMAIFASPTIAQDGDRTSGDKAAVREAFERTNHLPPEEQAAETRKVHDAFAAAKKVTTGKMIDGEFVQDR